MPSNKFLLILTMVSVSLSAYLGWYLFASTPPEHSFSQSRADLQSTSALDDSSGELGDPQIDGIASRRVPAAPISEGSAVSARYLDRGVVQYYDPNSGQVWQVRANGGHPELVSGALLPGFIKTFWSPNKHEVLTEFSTSRGLSFKYFDYTSKRSVTLSIKIKSVAFSPDGSHIVYFAKNGDEGSISLAAPDGQETKQLFSTRLNTVEVSWPQEEVISFIAVDDQTTAGSLFMLTLDRKLTKFIDSVPGLEARWAPNGSQVLFSYFDDDGQLVAGVLDAASGNPTALDIRARASECAWTDDSSTLICAAAQTPVSIAVVQNHSKIPVDFYEISLASGAKKLLYSSGTRSAKASVSEIFLSTAGDYVFFVNRYDNKLYSFKR